MGGMARGQVTLTNSRKIKKDPPKREGVCDELPVFAFMIHIRLHKELDKSSDGFLLFISDGFEAFVEIGWNIEGDAL